MIFHYMYRQTGDERLRAACDFWHEQTLAHARWEDGIAGYKFFFPSEQPEWRTDLSAFMHDGRRSVAAVDAA